MANVTLYKQDGSENGKVELNDAIWAVEPNENVVFDAVVMQRASLRQGTHAVKKPFCCFWRRSQALAPKGYWSCPPRFNPQPAMAWRWDRLRTDPAQLCIQAAKEGSSFGNQIRTFTEGSR